MAAETELCPECSVRQSYQERIRELEDALLLVQTAWKQAEAELGEAVAVIRSLKGYSSPADHDVIDPYLARIGSKP